MSITSLVLPTPGEHGEASENGSVEERTRVFHFPYPSAYDIQLRLMSAVFRTLEDRQVGVFESPTGTGKTLSLLCSAFTWLENNRHRSELGVAKAVDAQTQDDQEPDWVIAHEEAKQRKALEAYEESLRSKLRDLRRSAIKERHQQRQGGVRDSELRKKQRTDTGEESDSDFLVEDYDERPQAKGKKGGAADNLALSAELCAVMAEFESTLSGPKGIDEEPESKPKIFYASRTHSQLAQLIDEVKKTEFGSSGGTGRQTDDVDPVRTITLGSRKQMCINADVQRIGATQGIEAMNERCLELMESGKEKRRCPHLPPMNAAGEAQMDNFRDHALAEVQDIEELVSLGKRIHVCPYFGSRRSIRQAELVALPYNLLLQADARDSLNLNLDGSIVIIDEAHNLIDTLLSTYSAELSATQVEQASKQVAAYLARFSMRLKGLNEEHLRTLRTFLDALAHFCAETSKRAEGILLPHSEGLAVSNFIGRLGGTVDQINFMRIEHWLKDTRIARKISGYADKQWVKEHPDRAPRSANSIRAMHALEAFLLALSNRSVDGRILITTEQAKDKVSPPTVTLKYLLLNPADAFRPLLDSARAIVLAGGTMEPMSEFRNQLFGQEYADRFTSFSCGHIVPKSNVQAAIVNAGPRGHKFEFNYQAWKNTDMLDDLANALSNYCNIVPNGMIVFFPSYSSLESTLSRWKQTDVLTRIGKRKQVFFEPQHAHQVDSVLQQYGAASTRPRPEAPKGAILFAVVGAKLSEGINFANELARCVVMVGLPFPNRNSQELVERMSYLRVHTPPSMAGTDQGKELYVNLCMRAVNQSIGRAIRHRNDYAMFLLLDSRFGRPDILSRLPLWIRNCTSVQQRFGSSVGAVAAFFRDKQPVLD